MRNYFGLIFMALLLAACGSATSSKTTDVSETAAAPTETSAQAATATQIDEFDAATAEEVEDTTAENPLWEPASTVEEAATVRSRDWTKGPSQAAVTLIEYGDFQ